MKKLYSLLLLICSCLQDANGQVLFVDSTRFVTGVNCCTSIEYAIPTADNGILFLGTEHKNPHGIIPSFLLDTVELNVFIGKLDADKHISWLKIYGGTQDDGPASAVQTADGGYAVVATTESANGDVAGFHGIEDIWLLRLDAMGNLLWQKCFGSATGGSRAMSTLGVTTDFLMGGSVDDKAQTVIDDKQLLLQFQDIAKLPNDKKAIVKELIDAFLFKNKIQQQLAS